MMTMTTPQTRTVDATTVDGALFSNPDTAEPVVVPGLDPASAAAVFSSPY